MRYPARIPDEEMPIRIKEWELAGLTVEDDGLGNRYVYRDPIDDSACYRMNRDGVWTRIHGGIRHARACEKLELDFPELWESYKEDG